jgi:hypothetical protein
VNLGGVLFIPFEFLADQITLPNGQQLYFPEQAASYVPFLKGTNTATNAPAAFVGLTNQQLWSRFGLALGGAVAPASAVLDPNSGGYVGTPSSPQPVYALTSEGSVETGDVYHLAYLSVATGQVTKETAPTAITVGWNVITRTINGRPYSFLVNLHLPGEFVPGVPLIRPDGQQLYSPQQAANYVPFPKGSSAALGVPAALIGLTNQQLQANFGICYNGAIIPAGAVFDPTTGRYVGTPADYPPVCSLGSSSVAKAGSKYFLTYGSGPGTQVTEKTATPIALGWNLLTRTINGQLYTFFVEGV